MFNNASEALRFILVHTNTNKRRHISRAAAQVTEALEAASVDHSATIESLIAEKEELQNKLLEATARAEAAEAKLAAKPKTRRTRTKKNVESTDEKQSD